MESRMRRKVHVRFGEGDRRNRLVRAGYGAPVPTLHNAKTQVVGIRAAGEDAKGRYRLRSQGTNGLHLVTGKRFFSHYGLDVAKARTFDAEKIEDGLVGFCLAEKPVEKPAEVEAETETKPATKKARRQPAEATA